VTVDGTHYSVRGAKPGPAPAHRIGIWVGAYGPRMLRLTGRLADGWLPSLGGKFIAPEDAPRMHAAIDEAAKAAGRDPEEIERVVNVVALDGEPGSWAEQPARVVTEFRFSTVLVVPAEDPIGSSATWEKTWRRACARCCAEGAIACGAASQR
jgi:alkanesulfonate monooxygenase SsuD/methylene tetrahydromethanopterin reductase-like flavin-dependent oxidoreductase (luciferase family)